MLSVPMTMPLEQLNAQIFRDHLHTHFQAGPGGAETVRLELTVVEEQDRAGMELFSLHFTGPFLPRLSQGTYRLEHEKIGVFEIFMTPLSATPEEGTIYESVFHRFRKRPS